MDFGLFAVFYLTLGTAVALGEYAQGRGATALRRAGRAGAALWFWPLFLPFLLAPREPGLPAPEAGTHDDLTRAVAQVEREIASALQCLRGWADEVLVRERPRLAELRAVWHEQAHHIRAMEHWLAQAEPGAATDAGPADPQRHRSEAARADNLRRMRELHQRARGELFGTLAWVRELLSMIHLARFSGAPASRAAELVAQIAAAVDALARRAHTAG